MDRGYPSLTALLGLLAMAGYQNRDKIGEWLGGLGGGGQPGAPPSDRPKGLDGLLGGLGGAAAGGGGFLDGALRDLKERFGQNGQGEAVDSWIGPGQNREIAPPQLERAIGTDVLATLAQQTGMSREEILQRLSRELPNAVDRYTPNGRLPA